MAVQQGSGQYGNVSTSRFGPKGSQGSDLGLHDLESGLQCGCEPGPDLSWPGLWEVEEEEGRQKAVRACGGRLGKLELQVKRAILRSESWPEGRLKGS